MVVFEPIQWGISYSSQPCQHNCHNCYKQLRSRKGVKSINRKKFLFQTSGQVMKLITHNWFRKQPVIDVSKIQEYYQKLQMMSKNRKHS